ncbi:hypothetical protein ACH5RR_007161 [Cinchona calisaya]|uniref:NB-ARC domain-containing protein n=1 Tax=Cinchona calisaya TaxID=153742 RepID=A0ABD3AR22_9GENT
MPGLGKTTLAKKIYNDASVVYHFHIRAYGLVFLKIIIRKVYCLAFWKTFFFKILDCFYEMNEDDLVEELYKSLKGKRYLVTLDGVWDVAVWNDLGTLFPNDFNGSRILFTSQLHNVICKLIQTANLIFFTRSLMKLFPKEYCLPTLSELGKQIAKMCKWLPFSTVIVAGILANMEKDEWTEVVESLSSNTVCGTEGGTSTLELSYKHLLDYLKSCLLYFGIFKEYTRIPMWRLMWLWIAEGFVQKSKSKSIDEVAEDHMMDLISGSLVIVSQQSSRGGVNACRVHDLLHGKIQGRTFSEVVTWLSLIHSTSHEAYVVYAFTQKENI